MKRSSKSRKSNKSIYQYSDSSSKTSDDTPTPTCLSWLHRMVSFLFLILLAVCGAMCNYMILNDMLHGQFDSAVSHLAVRDFVNNELPR
jgi:hypothetical protein